MKKNEIAAELVDLAAQVSAMQYAYELLLKRVWDIAKLLDEYFKEE